MYGCSEGLVVVKGSGKGEEGRAGYCARHPVLLDRMVGSGFYCEV